MKITIHTPGAQPGYNQTIDTGVAEVTITEAFIGPKFATVDGEDLSVMMRDAGFELVYFAGDEYHMISCNEGKVLVSAAKPTSELAGHTVTI
jgi:hypothetical protein